MKSLILLIAACFVMTSCMDKGKIKVENKVHNTKLESMSFGKVAVYSSLLPGQTSTEVEVIDRKKSFPIIHQLEFYMVSNGSRVYLKTKNKYVLEAGGTLLITISDTTEVINPLLE
jgi:hypothetical protein